MQIVKVYSNNSNFVSDIRENIANGYRVVSMVSYPQIIWQSLGTDKYINSVIVVVYEKKES